jgi:hypothetical protein
LQRQQKNHHHCHCDATFLTSSLCRPDSRGSFLNFRPQQVAGACPGLASAEKNDANFTQHFVINRVGKLFQFQGINCSASTTDDDDGHLLLYVQGGVHWKWQAVSMWQQLLRPLLANPVVVDCAARQKLTIIWSGYMAQSSAQDGAFPHQAMGPGLIFQREMPKFLL